MNNLPFTPFIHHLQRQGFTIGVEHYLRLYTLLDELGEYHPQQLKTLLCPIFATNKDQQQQFYTAFDQFFSHWQKIAIKPQIDTEEAQETIFSKNQATPRWQWLLALLLWLLLAVLGWQAYQTLFSSPTVAPETPSTELQDELATSDTVTTSPNFASPEILLPEQPEPLDLPWYQKHWNTLRWGIISLPLLLWLGWELWAWQRRRLAVLRQRGRKPPMVWSLRITPPEPQFVRSEEFYQAARSLHQRLSSEQQRLDMPTTVQHSIEQLGYAELCYQPVQRVPEYLVLIDLPYGRDHHARWAETLFKALHEEDLHVQRFFYHRNPRICFADVNAERLFLQDLQARYGACRLLLIGTGDGLLDPVTGVAVEWLTVFEAWSQRALLTPTPPAQWGAREVQLAREFTVLPASLDGLNALLTYFEEQRGESLRERKQRDTRVPPPPLPESGEVSAAQLQALRVWLADEGLFRWLCACSVYPELHWDLTLHLASLACLPDDLLTEEKLLRLLRLPWFCTEAMPDNWRWALLQELDLATAQGVRQALIALLEQHPPPQDSVAWDGYQLQLAVQRWWLGRFQRGVSWLARWQQWLALKRVVVEQSVVQDYALLRLLESAPSQLVFWLPKRLRKVLFRDGVGLLGVKSWMRFGIVCGVCGLLSLGLPIRSVIKMKSESDINVQFQSIVEQKHKIAQTKSFSDSGLCPEWSRTISKPAIYILAMGANTGKLNKADKDAKDFANSLKYYYLRNSKQPVLVCLLINKQASITNWWKVISKLQKEVSKQDTVIFYFSGHGTAQLKEEFFCPENFLIMGDGNKLLDKILMRKLTEFKTNNLNLFLDTSYTSGLFRGQHCVNKNSKVMFMQNSGLYPHACRENNTFLSDPTYVNASIYTASRQNQDAFETKTGGLFTQTFLKILNSDKNQELSQIFHKTANQIAKETKGEMMCRQQPQMWQNGKLVYTGK